MLQGKTKRDEVSSDQFLGTNKGEVDSKGRVQIRMKIMFYV